MARVGDGRPLWLPVVLVWFGAGALFAWGLWQTLNRVLGSPLGTGDQPTPPAAVELFGMLAGLLIATAATFHLVEQRQNQPFTQA